MQVFVIGVCVCVCVCVSVCVSVCVFSCAYWIAAFGHQHNVSEECMKHDLRWTNDHTQN